MGEDWELQMSRHNVVESSNSRHLTMEWQQEVKVYEYYSAYRDKVLQMILQLSFIWDELFGRTSTAKNRIGLIPNSSLIHSAPYKAGTIAWEFQLVEIEKILSQKVINLAQLEWAIPTVCEPEKDGLLFSYVNYRKLK